MLTLPIKKNWFDMIRSGIKLEEYRDISNYYAVRFMNVLIPETNKDNENISTFINDCRAGKYLKTDEFSVLLRNGYSKNSPTIEAFCNLKVGTGKPEWGAKENTEYFVLKIDGISETKK